MGPVIEVEKVPGGWFGRVRDRYGGEVLYETLSATREAARLFAWAWRYDYVTG